MTQETSTQAVPRELTIDQQQAIYAMGETAEYADRNGEIRHPTTGRIIDGGDGPDDQLNVTFSTEAVFNKAESFFAGITKYSDMDFITIIAPGDTGKLATVHTPVTEYHKWRFPVEYAAFKNGQGALITGTPLSLWPLMTPSQIKDLEFKGIRTVEQVAELSDSNAASMTGFYKLKQQAKQFLASAKDTAQAGAMQAELEAVKAQAKADMDAMKAQMAQLLELMQAKAAPQVEADDTQEEAPAPKKKNGAAK